MTPTTALAVDLLLKATLLSSLALLILSAMRKGSAADRRLVAVLSVAGLLALPALALLLPSVPLPVLPHPAGVAGAASTGADVAAAAPARRARVDSIKPEISQPVESASSQVKPSSEFRVSTAPAVHVQEEAASTLPVHGGHLGIYPPEPVSPAVLPRAATLLLAGAALWAAGVLVVLGRLLFGLFRVRNLSRNASGIESSEWLSLKERLAASLGVARDVPLLFSRGVSIAMTAGVRRPVLLLPAEARGWPEARRRVVLLHELAHVSRHDCLWLLLAEVTAALWWFHPLVWALVSRLRSECELASDDLVLSTRTRPSEYAAELLGIVASLQGRRMRALPAMAMARPSQLEGRLRAILDPRLSRLALSPGRARLLGATLAGAFALLAALSPWSAPRADAAADLTPAPRFSIGVSDDEPRATFASTNASEPRKQRSKEKEVAPAVVPAISKGKADLRTIDLVKKRNPSSGSGWYDRGMDLHHDEQYEEAIAAFQKAIELGYKEDAATYNIACGYSLLGKKDLAFEWLNKAVAEGFDVYSYLDRDDDLDNIRKDPRFRELKKAARQNRGHEKIAEEKRAVAHLERLDAKKSADGHAYYEVGSALLHAGRYDLSAKAFRTSAEKGNREGASLYNAACALSLGGDKREALIALRKAIENGYDDPKHMDRDSDLDDIRDEKEYAELHKMAEEMSLSSIDGDGPFGKLTRTFRFGQRSRWRDTAARISEFTRKYPKIGHGWFNLGYAQLMGDRPEAALEAYKKALDLGYRKPTTLYNLACAYARLDDKEKAFDHLSQALDAGFTNSSLIRNDEDLDNLRGDARFRKALERAKQKDREHDDDDD